METADSVLAEGDHTILRRETGAGLAGAPGSYLAPAKMPEAV